MPPPKPQDEVEQGGVVGLCGRYFDQLELLPSPDRVSAYATGWLSLTLTGKQQLQRRQHGHLRPAKKRKAIRRPS